MVKCRRHLEVVALCARSRNILYYTKEKSPPPSKKLENKRLITQGQHYSNWKYQRRYSENPLSTSPRGEHVRENTTLNIKLLICSTTHYTHTQSPCIIWFRCVIFTTYILIRRTTRKETSINYITEQPRPTLLYVSLLPFSCNRHRWRGRGDDHVTTRSNGRTNTLLLRL